MKSARKKTSIKKSGKSSTTRVLAASNKKQAPRKKSNVPFTKQQHAEVMKVYNAYWENYLLGNVKPMAFLLDDHYTQVGSAESEVFSNKKDAVEFLYNTIDQVAGKVDMRNRVITVEPFREFILVRELTDLHVLAGSEWVFHSKFRASSLMNKKKEGWKFIHQHSSFPDIRAQEGDNIAIEKIEAENLQLRDAIKRRTVDLEHKNRELEIETALERVRARTMAMQDSDELQDVANLLFKQIQSLGIPAWSCGFNIWDKGDKVCTGWMSGEGMLQPPFKIPLTKSPTFIRFVESKTKGESFYVEEVGGKALAEHYKYMLSLADFAAIAEKHIKAGYPLPSFQINHVANFRHGNLIFITSVAVPEAHEVFKRFTVVFEQTYTRFLDLQKAEAQAREAQIEAALERVRARTMGMQKSEDLREVVNVLYAQLKELGFQKGVAAINIMDHDSGDIDSWGEGFDDGYDLPEKYHVPYFEHRGQRELIMHWKSGTPYATVEIAGQEKKSYDNYYFFHTDFVRVPETTKQLMMQQEVVLFSMAYMQYGALTWTPSPISEEQSIILQRFAKVFEQTYTRFLDLQKAEGQAREAQIEAALERVRSRTMAMHKSDELNDVAGLLFKQVSELGIKTWTTGFNVWSEDNSSYTDYITSPQGNVIKAYTIDTTRFSVFGEVSDAKKRGDEFWVQYLEGELLRETYKELTKFGDEGQYEKMLEDGFEFPSQQYDHFVFGSRVSLMFITYEPVPEAHEIFKRFGKVFEQSYTRFLDLKKAEAQAHEAQIEAALERVRSRSMAMHKSEELLDVITVVSQQLELLKLKFNTVSFASNNQEHDYRFWFAAMGDPNPLYIQVPYLNNPMYDRMKDVVASRTDFYTDTLTPEESRQWHEHMFAYADLSFLSEETKAYILRSGYARSIAITPSIMLIISNYAARPYTDDENDIIRRFAAVFQQSYTRFLDLQKAEAQAREATIEASLERVRARAMAMHSSEDLSSTASLVFTELRKLNINPIRCGVGLLSKETRKGQLYSSTSSPDGDNLSLIGWVSLAGHPVLEAVYQSWIDSEDYFPVLSGESMKSYYQQLVSGLSVPVPDVHSDEKQYGYFFPVSIGQLYAWSLKPYEEGEVKIFKRFASVIDLTFRRYLELQQSETIAREAIRQASLDRVRAEIASMRTAKDLERITPLIWKELTTLNISFIRCGVFIMDEEHEIIHNYLSAPDGKAIAAFHLPYSTPGAIARILKHWQERKIFLDHWDDAAMKEFANILVNQGIYNSPDQYLNTLPKGGFYLHFLPFNQGMLYVGNITQLNEDEVKLIQSLADAFSTAYARYEDFNKLEAAKQQVDRTLVDLKQAQQQLVQSEKMASLGELTAGIAHEIQNPLNFVNNFSEVNAELIDELEKEVDKGNLSEVRAIAKDIRENEQKIVHHGKRADAIVKGMLQHSRSSSGVKEPTDINVLADEYLRLAYHGLRAKDKSFNATMKTDFDDTIGNINIIPQDIGRVILNLITNAFYAVTEKKKLLDLSGFKNLTGLESLPDVQGQVDYEPTVIVSTKKLDNKVEVSVKDNGNGIPQKILDKIFQPFFTTKPTGQGTGLGLSLGYDIVKAHAGDLNVQTTEGEGSEFVIIIPLGK